MLSGHGVEVAKAAVSILVEAHLAMMGPKDAQRFLRSLAARLAQDGNVHSIREGPPDGSRDLAIAWLREQLPKWLVAFG